MKTLADLKRRLQVGVHLICKEQTFLPQNVGMDQTIIKVQTNGYYCTSTRYPNSKRLWVDMPKASDLQWLDADTFKVNLGRGHHKVMAFVSVSVNQEEQP
jgi:hypothetical protein